jgi:hypothetical protein
MFREASRFIAFEAKAFSRQAQPGLSSEQLIQHEMEGVRFYTHVKTVIGRWPTGIRAGVSTAMPTHG